MGIEEGTCWDEPWVLYGNQFDNKFHIKKKHFIYKKRVVGQIWNVVYSLLNLVIKVSKIQSCVFF